MRLKLTCKNCRRNIEIEGDAISRAIQCPNCDARLEIPANILDVDEVVGVIDKETGAEIIYDSDAAALVEKAVACHERRIELGIAYAGPRSKV